ncbi:MAG TPA: DUF3107 family protein [Acidimicrobiia bacterium]|nr:DUF3107 family protein [Acidimicrobiia bacterium]
MKVRIGIADSTKVIELDVPDVKEFEDGFAGALANDDVLVWVEDTKNRRIGIPASRVAYVEIETEDAIQNVGFGRS